MRAFKRKYSIDENAELAEIVKDEIDFYAHVFAKLGVKMNLWKKMGNSPNVGRIRAYFIQRPTQARMKLKACGQWLLVPLHGGLGVVLFLYP
jgi:hypothetical protein